VGRGFGFGHAESAAAADMALPERIGGWVREAVAVQTSPTPIG